VLELGSRLGVDARGQVVANEVEWDSVSSWPLETHGRVDVLVNNAGVFFAARLENTTLEEFRYVREVNQAAFSSGCG
jgi:3alpha(or 20beta)-hydroxysteroid dehydrogenase